MKYEVEVTSRTVYVVEADSYEEARELAIQKARQLMGSYNSLCIDFVDEVENDDCEFENEYEVLCFNTDGILVHEYSIEADHILGAATAAKEFFGDDYPNETLSTIRVIVGDDFEEYNV